MEVYFDDALVRHETIVPHSLTQNPPFVQFDPKNEGLYTIILFDTTAPYPDNPANSPYLHWVISNVQQTSDDGDQVLAYRPPSPPKDSPPHTYILASYRQGEDFSPYEIKDYERPKFDVDKFVQDSNLEPFHYVTFYVGPKAVTDPSQDRADREAYFFRDSKLNDRQQRYCRCVLHVGAKVRKGDEFGKASLGYVGDPYAICTASVKEQSACSPHLNFDEVPDLELRNYAYWHGIPIPKPYNRKKLLAEIYNRYAAKYVPDETLSQREGEEIPFVTRKPRRTVR